MKKILLVLALFVGFATNAQLTVVEENGHVLYQNDPTKPNYVRAIVEGQATLNPGSFYSNPGFRVFAKGDGSFNYYFVLAKNTSTEKLYFDINYITQDANGSTIGAGVLKANVAGSGNQFWFGEGIEGIYDAKFLYIQIKQGNKEYVAKFDLTDPKYGTNVPGIISAVATENKGKADNPFGGTQADNPFAPNTNNITNSDQWISAYHIGNLNPFELEGYLDVFVKDAAAYGIDLSYIYDGSIVLEFKRDDEAETIAYTDSLGNDRKVHIVVSPLHWNQASEAKRLAIFYHELGHDILNFKHDSERGPLMSVYAASDYTFAELYDLRHKMFTDYINGVEYGIED